MSQCIALRALPGSERLSRCIYDGLWDGPRCYMCWKKHEGLLGSFPRRGVDGTEEEQLRRLLDECGLDADWLFSGTEIDKLLLPGRETSTRLARVGSRGA